jgi:two-component system sensor histidine kinase TctE
VKGSLLSRLLWRLSLVTALLVCVVSLIVVEQFRNTADTLRDRNLSGQASDIAGHLKLAEGGRLSLDLPAALHENYATSDGMYVYQILDAEGRVVMASDGSAKALSVPDADSSNGPDLFQINRNIEGKVYPFFGVSLPVTRGGKAFFVQVAQGPQHSDALIDEILSELWDHAGWAVVLVYLAVIGVIFFTVRASLAPIREAAADAASIGPLSIDRRISAEKVPAEVRPLVAAFNTALARIGESYRKQREFTDNAAHELRTPIAVLRAHVDALDDRALARELGSDVALLDRLVNQLLRLARADDLRIPEDSVAELNAIMLETAAMMGPAAIMAGKTIAAQEAPHPVRVFGDGGYIGIALRNLIENGLRATPPGSAVEIEVDPAGVISVFDQGPGVPEGIRDKMFERFWRGDTRDDGAGLGLSIVQRIVEAHGGSVEVTGRPGGGACFKLRFSKLSDC